MTQKYKILKVKSELIHFVKLENTIEDYFRQFVKKVNSIDGYTYLYFKKSISDKRLVKIYNLIIKWGEKWDTTQ